MLHQIIERSDEVKKMFTGDIYVKRFQASTWMDAIKQLGSDLIKEGNVEPDYIAGLIKREQEFPTGLDLGNGLGASIPHLSGVKVNRSGIYVGVTDAPVQFRAMEDPSRDVPVRIIFVLALSEPGQHMETLKQLMAVLTDERKVEYLLEADEAELETAVRQIIWGKE